jgi:hypothetical protein
MPLAWRIAIQITKWESARYTMKLSVGHSDLIILEYEIVKLICSNAQKFSKTEAQDFEIPA